MLENSDKLNSPKLQPTANTLGDWESGLEQLAFAGPIPSPMMATDEQASYWANLSIAISLKRIADSMTRVEGVRFERDPDVLHNPSHQADNDGWIDWHGGPCPVAPETMVEVRFRDGETSPRP